MNNNIKKFIPVLLLGLFFILFGVYIYVTEIFVAHNRYNSQETLYVGKESVRWAYSLMSFGIALFAPIFKKNFMVLWMTIFLVLAVLIPFFY